MQYSVYDVRQRLHYRFANREPKFLEPKFLRYQTFQRLTLPNFLAVNRVYTTAEAIFFVYIYIQFYVELKVYVCHRPCRVEKLSSVQPETTW